MTNSHDNKKSPSRGGNRKKGSTSDKVQTTSTTANLQRQVVLDLVKMRGGKGVNTLEARQPPLGIMSPAPRILELKAKGHHIVTIPTDIVTDDGVMHQGVARYVLLGLAPESEGSHA
jgi:hypothetical protein